MVDWNKTFEFTWRILVFIVAIAIIVIVSTDWTRWQGGEGWQRTNDAYLQSDLTPISAKVTGYIRELPIRDYQRVRKGQVHTAAPIHRPHGKFAAPALSAALSAFNLASPSAVI